MYAGVSVLQLGGSDDTNADTVNTEPYFDALMHHAAGRLAVPGASAAAEVKSSWTLVRRLLQCRRRWCGGPATTVWDDANRVDAGVYWACACGNVVGLGV